MTKKILVISGSPKSNGNTETLIRWFIEGARTQGAETDVVRAASLKLKASGCLSCRKCQTNREYGCVIDDDMRGVQARMISADVIVMATPLYFFSASAQIKTVIDRMFSLYKWDNRADTMETVLKGKTLLLIASAYENIGLEELVHPFQLTADYTGMRFESLLLPNAGVSGEVVNLPEAREKAMAMGKRAAMGEGA